MILYNNGLNSARTKRLIVSLRSVSFIAVYATSVNDCVYIWHALYSVMVNCRWSYLSSICVVGCATGYTTLYKDTGRLAWLRAVSVVVQVWNKVDFEMTGFNNLVVKKKHVFLGEKITVYFDLSSFDI